MTDEKNNINVGLRRPVIFPLIRTIQAKMILNVLLKNKSSQLFESEVLLPTCNDYIHADDILLRKTI